MVVGRSVVVGRWWMVGGLSDGGGWLVGRWWFVGGGRSVGRSVGGVAYGGWW